LRHRNRFKAGFFCFPRILKNCCDIEIVSKLDFSTFPEFLKKLLRHQNSSKAGFFDFPRIPQKTVATSK
jgi:hypothetical protein